MTKFSHAVLLTADAMEPRLFDLDFQLISDACLSIIAVLVLFFAMSYFLFNPARAFLQKVAFICSKRKWLQKVLPCDAPIIVLTRRPVHIRLSISMFAARLTLVYSTFLIRRMRQRLWRRFAQQCSAAAYTIATIISLTTM